MNNQDELFRKRVWKLGHDRTIELGLQSRIMGILNVTPDSFSDGGKFTDIDVALKHAAQMVDEGADIIDIGGESTRPDATPVSLEEEQDRVLPIIDAIAARLDCAISIDTYHASTASLAIKQGAHMINDVWGLQYDEQMGPTIAKANCAVCIMHNSRKLENSDVVVDEGLLDSQKRILGISLEIARECGIGDEFVAIDPGFGFGKNAQENLMLLDQIAALNELQYPVLVGTSRKRFTGSVLGENDKQKNRDIVTSATSVVARMAGCQIFRVHDVKTNKMALNLSDALIRSRQN